MRIRTLAAALAVVAVTVGAAPAVAGGATGGAITGVVPGLDTPAARSLVATGLSIPWGIAWLPSGRAALVTQRDDARMWLVGREGGMTDLGRVAESLNTEGEGGLMGVAVSPTWDGLTDRAVYVLHTAAEGTRVARMSFDGARLSDYRVIVSGIGKSTYHNGGQLAFGPDGYLYASTGDIEQPALAQDRTSLNGKILRFTTAGRPAPGNPFGTLVYSLGHRNPQGLAWDSAGRLWAAELGQNTHDELNLIEAGRNYGWPVCEGACARSGYTDPRWTWSPAEASPSGLAIVGDTAFLATLRGQRLWSIELSGTQVTAVTAHLAGRYGRLRAVSAVPGAQEIWLGTSNVDGRGGQPAGSDRLMRFRVTG